MRSAIIADGIVTNVIMGSLPESIPCENGVGIGWSYDGVNFIPPAPELPTAEERIAELKQFLRETDYVAMPDYDKEKPDVLAQRQVWRQQIRELNGED